MNIKDASKSKLFFNRLRQTSCSALLTAALGFSGTSDTVNAQATAGNQKEQAVNRLNALRGRAVTTFHCIHADVEMVFFSGEAAIVGAAAAPGIVLALRCGDEPVWVAAPPGFNKEFTDIGVAAIQSGKKVLIVVENSKVTALGLVN